MMNLHPRSQDKFDPIVKILMVFMSENCGLINHLNTVKKKPGKRAGFSKTTAWGNKLPFQFLQIMVSNN
jgi:hypothetical protein